MRYQDLLAEEGFTRRKDGKYISSQFQRAMSIDLAKDRAARNRGYGNYKIYQSIARSKDYKKWAHWYRKVNDSLDRNFDLLFGKAFKQGFKPFSKSLIDLMRETTFQNGSDGTWYHGLAWSEYGFGKYHGE